MRARRGISFSVVVSMALTVVLGVAPAPGQPTSTAAVDVTFPDTAGTLQLPGQLYRPDGPGAFPAVVVLPGCGGIQPLHHRWAHTLQQWGYVALLVDSLSPRGARRIFVAAGSVWTPCTCGCRTRMRRKRIWPASPLWIAPGSP
jgi:hypothetical protein